MLALPAVLRNSRLSVPARVLAGLACVIACAAAVFGVRVLMAQERATPIPASRVASTGAAAGGAGFTGPRPGGEPSGLVSSSVPPAGAAPSPSGAPSGGQSGGASQPGQPAASTAPPAAVGQQGATGQAGQPGTAGQAGQSITVHVVGQVARPAVVSLAAGARVGDAVRAAGGLTARADAAAVNLARLVVDGEQIRIPRPGEALPPPAGQMPGGGSGAAATAPSGGSGGVGSAAAGSAAGGGAGQVNLNTADLSALDGLPGVGPVLAQRILDWRTEHGRFTSVDELGEVSGIGEKLMAQLGPKVTV